MGAFGSRDSLLGDAADPATLNRYTYAEGNPVASCDPTGHVKAYKNRLSSQRATQRRARASGSRRTTSAKKTSVFAKVSAAVARFVSPLVKAPPLKKMTKELSYATNRTFSRLPPAPAASVVAVGAGAALRNVYYGSGKGGGSPGGYSSGTARTVALTASAIRARNYAAAAKAAFCGTAAHMGESKTQGVDLAAIGHGALDLLGFIPGIGAAADVANGLWYAAEGNYVDAAMSFVSAIPGVGDAFGGRQCGPQGRQERPERLRGRNLAEDRRKCHQEQHGGYDSGCRASRQDCRSCAEEEGHMERNSDVPGDEEGSGSVESRHSEDKTGGQEWLRVKKVQG